MIPTFAQLEAARLVHGHTVTKAAAALGISFTLYQGWKSGKPFRPGFENLERIEAYIAAAPQRRSK